MSDSKNPCCTGASKLNALGLPLLQRALPMALLSPTKLGLCLAAMLVTCVWGGLLDAVWLGAGGGAPTQAVEEFAAARFGATLVPASPTTASATTSGAAPDNSAKVGVFHTAGRHVHRNLLDCLDSWWPGTWVRPPGAIAPQSTAEILFHMLPPWKRTAYLIMWLISAHWLYALIFTIGIIAIWAPISGAISRQAAFEIARDEKISATEALKYARDRLLGGFLAAPLVPLGLMVLTALLLVVGGALLIRIPGLDWVGGLLFILPLFGGLCISLVILGLMTGGHLFWPTVAAEGTDAFDSFSRSFGYLGSKPYRAAWYAFVSLIQGLVGLLLLFILITMTLSVTRALVGAGTLWWAHGPDGSGTKLDALWPASDLFRVIAPSVSPERSWWEQLPALFIAGYVWLAHALLWAFAASYYTCACSVVYFLLRRDVDGIELDELYVDDDTTPGPADSSPKAPTTRVSPSVTPEGPPPAAAI